MNALFGEGKWDYWTKDVQGTDGLEEKINEYAKSNKAYMIVGIFDLSSDTEGVTNHMVGISEGPDLNGFLVTSNPIKQDIQNDIDDVFGINLNTKQYPLDIKIIDMKKWRILKEIDLSEYREGLNAESLYIKINERSLNSIELNYGVYDTKKTYPIGQLNLTTFKIE